MSDTKTKISLTIASYLEAFFGIKGARIFLGFMSICFGVFFFFGINIDTPKKFDLRLKTLNYTSVIGGDSISIEANGKRYKFKYYAMKKNYIESVLRKNNSCQVWLFKRQIYGLKVGRKVIVDYREAIEHNQKALKYFFNPLTFLFMGAGVIAIIYALVVPVSRLKSYAEQLREMQSN